MWKNNASLIQKLHVDLDVRDSHYDDPVIVYDDMCKDGTPLNDMNTEGHEGRKDILIHHWSRKLGLMRRFTCLELVEIEVAQCMCPSICCMLALRAMTDDLLLAPWSCKMPDWIRGSPISTRSGPEYIAKAANGGLSKPPSIDNQKMIIYGLRRSCDYITAHALGFLYE